MCGRRTERGSTDDRRRREAPARLDALSDGARALVHARALEGLAGMTEEQIEAWAEEVFAEMRARERARAEAMSPDELEAWFDSPEGQYMLRASDAYGANRRRAEREGRGNPMP